ncbi:uncharacterized protein LOC128669096 isoform X2 [Plodia interpunctella]|uniref:uncharacterized protein LOC128669096 isoform X2 n=1 Tax=Plodia interpunctella TaxID=58824 RepID=UPI0023688E74|nr:uncharacterized protein LOC128669096 isoform X2 [Plodia interpunctella]
MSLMTNFLKCFSGSGFRKPFYNVLANQLKRSFSDTPKADTESKQVTVQGNESEERVRVRRARASDVPRVLRFVREHARSAWPGLAAPPSGSHLILCDYVARALAQGLSGFLWHSMLAEQQEARRGWGSVRGLALGTAICPWDAAMLERWARCMRCTKSRRLMHFTAHCLRAPALHDKYRVQKILQITLMVPLDTPKRSDIINVLARNAIQRGRDVGFKVVRFDTCDAVIAQSLEDLDLKKEWVLTYDVYPDAIKETADKSPRTESKHAKSVEERPDEKKKGKRSHFLAVYTSHTPDVKPAES